MTAIDPSRTALVLGSSFLGLYAHAGFLNGMESAGILPARIAGASAGALAGALYCAGLRGEALKEAALDLKLRRSFLDAGALHRLPRMILGGSSGLFNGKSTVAHLRNLLGIADLQDAQPPLDIAVTDARTSLPAIHHQGPFAELVMASCAVPLLFTFQPIAGTPCLDGGIAGDLPFEHLIRNPEIDTLILHRIRHEDPSTPGLFRSLPGQALGVTRRTICHEVHRLRLDLARSHGKTVLELETLTPFPGLFRHHLAPLCYERGLHTGLQLAAHSCPDPGDAPASLKKPENPIDET